jgi:hypothetical protein
MLLASVFALLLWPVWYGNERQRVFRRTYVQFYVLVACDILVT